MYDVWVGDHAFMLYMHIYIIMYIQTQQARARENGMYYVCNWDSLLYTSK